VHDARDIAQVVLSAMPGRWRHTVGVARRAEELATALTERGVLSGTEAELLLAAAWLHDIGYADELFDTGFHPLDGALFLDRHRWPRRLSALVAHHSGAHLVGGVRGLADALRAYPCEVSPLADALTFADQTTGPHGERTTMSERMADMLRRHGPDSPNAHVHHIRAPYLLAIGARVEGHLSAPTA
jgi:putative nucleotidyltransferase with HDIG domain